MMNKSLLIGILFISRFVSLAQTNQLIVFEIIKEDSIRMFFNKNNRLVEKSCADFTRQVRVDREGYFNGYFEDTSNDTGLFGRGYYVHGKKNGLFEFFYENKKIRSKGLYHNDKPIGKWEYYHDNGLPERTLFVTERDTLLMRYVDRNGNLLVSEGNGQFYGFVMGNSGLPNSIIAKGAVKSGKPDGKWTSTMSPNITYCLEEFDNGHLIKGTFPKGLNGKPEVYHNRSFLNTLFLTSHLAELERLVSQPCEREPITLSNYKFNMQNFSTDLRRKIDRVLKEDFEKGKSEDYFLGDNNLSIQFIPNKDGKPENFVLLTGWGLQFFNTIKSSIRMQTTFPPDRPVFFHLKLHFDGGFHYQYNFRFSENRTVN